MRALLAALGLALPAADPSPPAATPPAAVDPLEVSRARIAAELVAIGGELQRAIVAGDAGPILARVPAGGLRCAGEVVPKARVSRDLRAPASWLHGVVFGPPGPPPPGPPASLRAFLAAAKDLAVVVSFQPDRLAGPEGRPCLDFRTKGVTTPGVPFCFSRDGGRWWLTESLYPCG